MRGGARSRPTLSKSTEFTYQKIRYRSVVDPPGMFVLMDGRRAPPLRSLAYRPRLRSSEVDACPFVQIKDFHMFHARPHLETHNRDLKHSAVAGAAYRLGLKLYDRRLKRTYDFRKRKEGDEVVFQTTVAPVGAPAWATDPLELWNRVEMAERRKDAQIARDYRIPLPLGLSDDAIRAMAIDMAEYIAQRLTTPVSVGVHRDAPITALGEAKVEQAPGCHAHLYFPTRKILTDQDIADQRSGGSGMGAKLHFLANKSTSGYFVEETNKVWAELANRYTSQAGLTPDYDHRSYRRQGLGLKPQPRLGKHATALERSGQGTERGDQVREAMVMAEVYMHAHRAFAAPVFMPLASASLAVDRSDASPTRSAASKTVPLAPPSDVSIGDGRSPTGAPVPAPPWTPMGRHSTLKERFRERYFALAKEGDRPEETYVYRLVETVERTIDRMRVIGARLRQLKKETTVAQSEHLDAQADLAGWQDSTASTEDYWDRPPSTLTRLVKEVARWLDPEDPIVVRRRQEEREAVTARMQERVERCAARVGALLEEAKPLRQEGGAQRNAFRGALKALQKVDEKAFPQLVAASWEEELGWIKRFFPEWLGPNPDVESGDGGRGRRSGPKLTPRAPGQFRGGA